MNKSRNSLKSFQTFRLINEAQTNTSKTKQAHAFGKTPRFFKQNPTCKQHYYAGQEIKTRRSGAGIGYSNKSDFTKVLTCSPGTARYTIKSEIDQRAGKTRGGYIGLGRNDITTGHYINRQLCRTPSSQRYQIMLINKAKAPVYSMRPRTRMLNKTLTIQCQNDNPGPADYNNPESIHSSKHSSKFATISYGTGKSKRFDTKNNRIPGPGSYNQISKLSTVGKYIISKDQGGTNAKFGTSRRVTKFEQAMTRSRLIPGVGSYKAPSQFGQYD